MRPRLTEKFQRLETRNNATHRKEDPWTASMSIVFTRGRMPS
jgi:hypothetical protein